MSEVRKVLHAHTLQQKLCEWISKKGFMLTSAEVTHEVSGADILTDQSSAAV